MEFNLNLIFSTLFLSFKLAFITSIILLLICIPFAYYLINKPSGFKHILLTISTLPLVLPPTVIGFYLLIFFARDNFIGHYYYQLFKDDLLFTFSALVLASIIYSLPFALQPIVSSMREFNKRYTYAAYTLGASKIKIFSKIILPLCKNSIILAFILSFAHTLGEFGVVLMIGGNIPEVTQLASIAIFTEVEILNYPVAHLLSLIMLVISFGFIYVTLKFANKS